jgi:hypothetical protein
MCVCALAVLFFLVSAWLIRMDVLFDRIFGACNVKLNYVAWLSLFGTWPRATQAAKCYGMYST